MKKNITTALLILLIAGCSKDEWHPLKREYITMKTLTHDTGQVWQADVMFWSITSSSDTIAYDYEAHPTKQTIKFKPDSTYQCTDSIAKLLSIPTNGKYFVDTSKGSVIYINYINGQQSAFPILQTTMPAEEYYKGMLALYDKYTTNGIDGFSLWWDVVIWFKRVK